MNDKTPARRPGKLKLSQKQPKKSMNATSGERPRDKKPPERVGDKPARGGVGGVVAEQRDERNVPPRETYESFDALGLNGSLLTVLDEVGYETPSPIQSASIKPLLEGEDLLGIAQTGTGKTAAFALPILNNIDLDAKGVQALVLAPTRELAIQVAEAFSKYAQYLNGFRVTPIYGGADYRGQLRSLKRGVHVVVGTPGRVMDHMRRESLDLSDLKTIVLDEADEMLRMGFIDDVTWILDQAPEERQIALFSATMPSQIKRVAQTYLHQPREIKIQAKAATVDRIDQSYWLVRGINKLDGLTRMLEVQDFDGVIIFARTKTATAELSEKLEARGYATAALNGDMNQQLRERVIDRFKRAQLDILVATDVAARGIDVARVSLVINYDVPYDPEAYVHRVGRTGRAGRTGKAILFISPREQRMLRMIERATRQQIKAIELPTRKEVENQRIQKFKSQLQTIVTDEDISVSRQLIESLEQDQLMDARDIAASLLHLYQKTQPLFLPKEAPMRDHASDDGFSRDKREKRSDRGSRTHHERGSERKGRRPGIELDDYQIGVGRLDGVQPGEIVGAIANEAGLESRFIGKISIRDDHSIVQLPSGMPAPVFKQLQKTWVRSKQLKIKRVHNDITPGNGGDSNGKSPRAKGGAREGKSRRLEAMLD